MNTPQRRSKLIKSYNVSNRHVIHLNRTQCYISIVSQLKKPKMLRWYLLHRMTDVSREFCGNTERDIVVGGITTCPKMSMSEPPERINTYTSLRNWGCQTADLKKWRLSWDNVNRRVLKSGRGKNHSKSEWWMWGGLKQPLLDLKLGEGTTSQGMQVPCSSWKRQGNTCYLMLTERDEPCRSFDFSPWDPY